MTSDTQNMDFLRSEIAAHFGEGAVEEVLAEAIAAGKAMHPDGELRKAYVYVALRRMIRKRSVVGDAGIRAAGIRAHGVVAVSWLWSTLRAGRDTKSTNSTSI